MDGIEGMSEWLLIVETANPLVKNVGVGFRVGAEEEADLGEGELCIIY
jgi:hypothetical protein